MRVWTAIEASAVAHSNDHSEDFSFDSYAEGFVEGVAIVWEKIRVRSKQICKTKPHLTAPRSHLV